MCLIAYEVGMKEGNGPHTHPLGGGRQAPFYPIFIHPAGLIQRYEVAMKEWVT